MLSKRLSALEAVRRPTITPCAEYYLAIMMTPEEAQNASAEVRAWRAQCTIDPVELDDGGRFTPNSYARNYLDKAEIHRRACERAAEIEAAALQGWDPNAPPPEA